MESLGGVLAGLVMKYADTVIKSFALGLSICLASVLSTFLFDFTLTAQFAMGAAIVISAVFLYNHNAVRPAAKPEEKKSQ
jgi:UDP-sugar transporter A1/2/3